MERIFSGKYDDGISFCAVVRILVMLFVITSTTPFLTGSWVCSNKLLERVSGVLIVGMFLVP